MIGIYKRYNKIVTGVLIIFFLFTTLSCGKSTKQTGTPTTTPTPTTQAPSTLSGYYITGTASVPKSYITSYKIQTESISVTSSGDYPLSGARIKVLDPITLADITKEYTGQTTLNTDLKGLYNIPFLDSVLGKEIVIEATLGDIRLISSTTVPEKVTTTALKKMNSSKTKNLTVEITAMDSIALQISDDSLLGISSFIGSSIPSQYRGAFLIRRRNILNKIHAIMTITPDPDSIDICASSTQQLIRQAALAKAADIKSNQEILALIELLLNYTHTILELESITIPTSCKNLNNYLLWNIFGMEHSLGPILARRLQGKTIDNVHFNCEQNADLMGVIFGSNSKITLNGNSRLLGSTLKGIVNIKGKNVDSDGATWIDSDLYIDDTVTDFILEGYINGITCDKEIKIGNAIIKKALKDHNNNYITNIFFIGNVEIFTGQNNTDLLNFVNALINKNNIAFSGHTNVTNVYCIITNTDSDDGEDDDDGDGSITIKSLDQNGTYWTTSGAVGPSFYITGDSASTITGTPELGSWYLLDASPSGEGWYASHPTAFITDLTQKYTKYAYIFISGSGGSMQTGYYVPFGDGYDEPGNIGNWEDVTIVLSGDGVYYSGSSWYVPRTGFHAQLQNGLGYEFKWYMFQGTGGSGDITSFMYPDSGWTTNQVPYFSSDPYDEEADATITWVSGHEGDYCFKAEKKRNPDDEFIYQEIRVIPYGSGYSGSGSGSGSDNNIIESAENVQLGGEVSWSADTSGAYWLDAYPTSGGIASGWWIKRQYIGYWDEPPGSQSVQYSSDFVNYIQNSGYCGAWIFITGGGHSSSGHWVNVAPGSGIDSLDISTNPTPNLLSRNGTVYLSHATPYYTPYTLYFYPTPTSTTYIGTYEICANDNDCSGMFDSITELSDYSTVYLKTVDAQGNYSNVYQVSVDN